MNRTLPALVILLGVCGPLPAAAHFPHDVMAEAAGLGDHVVAQYLYPERRLMVVSGDGGRTWSFVAAEASAEVLTSLEAGPDGLLYAANGVDAEVFVSLDGGFSWARTAEPDGGAVRTVAPTPAGELLAGTELGLHVSADQGATWTPLDGLGAAPVQQVVASPGHPDDPFIAALAGDACLWLSHDDGATWNPSVGCGDGSAPAVVNLSPGFAADDRIWAGTRHGTVLYSDDRGETWAEVDLATAVTGQVEEGVQDLVSLDDQRVLAVTASYGALCSDDGGAAWDMCSDGLPARAEQSSSQWGHFRRVDRVQDDPSAALLSSWEGLMISADEGETWVESCIVSPAFARSAAFSPAYPDDPTLWVGAYGSGVRSTDDGGDTWSVLEGLDDHLYVERIATAPGFPDDPVAMVVSSRRLMRTADGGTRFEHVLLPGIELLHHVVFSPAFDHDRLAFAVGTTDDEGQWVVARSFDAGETWESIWTGEPAPAPQIRDVFFDPTGHAVYAVQADPAAVLLSTDLGDSWATLLELPEGEILAAAFATAGEDGGGLVAVGRSGRIWIGGEEIAPLDTRVLEGRQLPGGDLMLTLDPTGLLRSADGGLDWVRVPTPFASPVVDVTAPPGLPAALVATTHYGAFFTCDEGENWHLLDRLVRYEEQACPLRYSGQGWHRVEGGGTGGGSYQTRGAGDAVSVEFFGREVRWIASLGPGYGSADVFVDDELVTRVDLDGDRAGPLAVFTRSFAEDGLHTLRLEVVDPGEGAIVDAVEVVRHTVINGPDEVHEAALWCEDLALAEAGGCCGGSCGGSGGVIEVSVVPLLLLFFGLGRRRRLPVQQ